MSDRPSPPNRTFPCPRCRKEVAWEGNAFRPFCSDRCRLIDLGHWASEDYRVPGPPAQPEESERVGKVIPFPEKD